MSDAGKRARSAPVAVLIPTRNGAEPLAEVLPAVAAQRARWPFTIAAVDSGSTDGTRDVLRRHDVAVQCIPAAQFQHGKTRNVLSSLVPEASYLVFLSQDATPLPGWLDALVGAVDGMPEAAGAFSRQVPRPDCNPFIARRMREEWPQIGGDARIVKRLPEGADANGVDHATAHFANTSSCVRRSVWQRIPFPEVAFGEDVAWARLVLGAGHALIYEPASTVLHSHSGSLRRQLLENVDHARAMRRVFSGTGASPPAPMPPRHGPASRMLRDVRYVWSMDAPLARRVAWLVYAPPWYAASLSGQWIGRHVDDWPSWARRRLSWQGVVSGTGAP